MEFWRSRGAYGECPYVCQQKLHFNSQATRVEFDPSEQTVTAGEAASSAALEMLAERSAKLEQTERDLDDNRRAQEATIRESEQRVLDKSLEAQVADLEKDLASERAGHMEAEVARTSGGEQSATLTKSLHEKEIALQRAEQKVATVEAKFDEHKKATLGDRASDEYTAAMAAERVVCHLSQHMCLVVI